MQRRLHLQDLCGTTKTTNKVPGVVKLEEPEVPNKDPKGFQTLKLSAPSTAVPVTQPLVGSTVASTAPKQTRRVDTIMGVSGPTQAIQRTTAIASTTAMFTGVIVS